MHMIVAIILSEPLVPDKLLLCPFAPKYFSVCFLRTRAFSYMTTAQWLHFKIPTLIHNYYLIYSPCPNLNNIPIMPFLASFLLIQDHELHFIAKCLQFPLLWNIPQTFFFFFCLSRHWNCLKKSVALERPIVFVHCLSIWVGQMCPHN